MTASTRWALRWSGSIQWAASARDEGIDDTGELKDGTKFQGLAGLRDYLAKNEAQFLTQFTRKLLGYSLGRQTLPSDKQLLTQMQTALKQNGGRFSAAVFARSVKSRQFLNRRNEATVAGDP